MNETGKYSYACTRMKSTLVVIACVCGVYVNEAATLLLQAASRDAKARNFWQCFLGVR